MSKKLVILAAAAVALSAGMAWAGNGTRDIYTDGALSIRTTDPYTDGSRAGKYDVYTDGARVTDRRDAFTDGS